MLELAAMVGLDAVCADTALSGDMATGTPTVGLVEVVAWALLSGATLPPAAKAGELAVCPWLVLAGEMPTDEAPSNGENPLGGE